MSRFQFVKVFGSILDSSVWSEPLATRVVWITLLAMADADGCVSAAVPGLVRRAQVSREDVEAALAKFLAPDPDDRSGVEDGRRLRVIRGGWQIVNYTHYREFRDPEMRRSQNREAQQRWRDRHRVSQDVSNSQQRHQESAASAHAEEDAEAEAEAEEDGEAEGESERETGAGAPVAADAAPPLKAPRSSSSKGKPKAARWKVVPKDWEPKDKHRALAQKKGKNFDDQVALFRDHEFKDWKTDADAAFSNWLRRDFGGAVGARRGPVQPNHGVLDPSKYGETAHDQRVRQQAERAEILRRKEADEAAELARTRREALGNVGDITETEAKERVHKASGGLFQ
jgi:hypothetical protein